MAKVEKAVAPDWTFEKKLEAQFGWPIAGVDEAGRGPWAGPVVAASVILDPERLPHIASKGLDDSKKLSPEVREKLFDAIAESAAIGIGIAGVERIDRDNILQATLWAMGEAVKALKCLPQAVLIDGNKAPKLPCPTETVIKGDGRSLSIAAASIIAKVTRDRIMRELAKTCPGYGFERHKGYGTLEHRKALARLGVSAYHRRSFKPVRALLKGHGHTTHH